MNDIPQISELVEVGHELIDDYRGGAIARMKTEHEQTLQTLETEKQEALGLFVSDKNQALDAFNQEKSAAFAKADSELAGRRAAVDTVLADVTKNADMRILHLDKAVHSQSSLSPAVDPNDDSQTEWVPVPTTGIGWRGVLVNNSKVSVVLPKAYIRPAGYPDYVEDKSLTMLQFVVASFEATSEQINEAIAAQGIEVVSTGLWGDSSMVAPAKSINLVGLHSYKRLFVRFVNRPYADGTELQNVLTYGGNPSFSIERVINFPNIPA